MNADFLQAYGLTMGNEGGYANNPADTGGETYKGVSRKYWPSWSGWSIIDAIKHQTTATGQTLAAFVNQQAGANTALQTAIQQFYKTNFWDVNSLDSVSNQLIKNEMFDTGVNMGTGTAAKFLQQALNLCNKNQASYADIAEDGKIGPGTLGTLNTKASPTAILNTLNMLQGEHYLEIMRANKTQEIFWPSWLSRTVENGKW